MMIGAYAFVMMGSRRLAPHRLNLSVTDLNDWGIEEGRVILFINEDYLPHFVWAALSTAATAGAGAAQ